MTSYNSIVLCVLFSVSLLQRCASIIPIAQDFTNDTFVDVGSGLLALKEYRLDAFPKDKISRHFGCAESEQFATNCACHIKCRGRDCRNAKEICVKYQQSHGCKYVLTRGPPEKMLATLKRVPTEKELAVYDISKYPDSKEDLESSDLWKSYTVRMNTKKLGKGTRLGDLISNEHGGRSKKVLAELMQNGSKHAYCGDTSGRDGAWKEDFLKGGISLVALTYKSPRSFAHSMRSWKDSGLLDMMQETKVIMNDPLPQDLGIAAVNDFEILQPKDIPNVKLSKPNVVTIGSAFYYALEQSPDSEYVLFLENDFRIDTDLDREAIQSQLVAAAGVLERGIPLVRLLSRKSKGCGTFKECGHSLRPKASPEVVTGKDRKRNWYSFYCPGYKGTEGLVAECLDTPKFRCFTSHDSNWSVNAILVKRSAIMSQKWKTQKDGDKSLPEIGLSHNLHNDGFETAMGFSEKWMTWKVPICITMEGLFIHDEIETGA